MQRADQMVDIGVRMQRRRRDAQALGLLRHGRIVDRLHVHAVIGQQLPGHGTVYLGQNLKFMAPVRPGDRVVATVSVCSVCGMPCQT